MTNIPTHLNHPKYRPDIDGLRAMAVLSVVVFHAFPSIIPGGFIGVDVFFVISGFLISSIIFSNLEQNRFSIIEFYNRRIRRIFPALITVMLTSLVFGWFVLLADEYKQLGKHIVGGSGFVSNFILWTESGYFDNAAESKPMLHLWSLAIEEQFYIFWPLLLAFVSRCKWSFLRITAVIAVLSFLANIFLAGNNPSSAFYLPISRFWELMIGGVLAYITLHRQDLISQYKNIQSVIGLTLLIAGLCLINKKSEFPGWWALLPTVSTFLLISAGSSAWINKIILSNKLTVWFGLISYPLYLWHWPLLSFARIVEGNPSKEIRAAIVLAAVFLAWATYKFIEKPLRFGSHKRVSLGLLLALIITGLLGYSCIFSNGYENKGFREKKKTEFSSHFENSLPSWKYFERENILDLFRSKCDFYNLDLHRVGKSTSTPIKEIDKVCYTRDFNLENTLLIWGDSHAQQLYPGLHKHLPKNWQILQVTSSGCAPDISVQHNLSTNYCAKSNNFALEAIKKVRPNIVIVGQNLGHKVERMYSIGSALESLGVQKIIFTGPSPHWTSDLPRIVVRKLWVDTPDRTFTGIDAKVLKDNEALKQNFKSNSSRYFVSIIDYFCNEMGCLTRIGSDRQSGITTWDYGHLTPIASGAFARDVLVPLIATYNVSSQNNAQLVSQPDLAHKAAQGRLP